MKYIIGLTLGYLLAVACLIAGDKTGTKSPRAIPEKINTEFTPEADVEYTMEGNGIYHTDNPGPASGNTHQVWGAANEFVYRTGLAKEYLVPAKATGPKKHGWHMVRFSSKDGKSDLIVEVDIKRGVVKFRSPINNAVKAGDLAKVGELLKRNPELVFNKDDGGETLLHVAAASGHKDVVELLLANGADVNVKNNNGETPLQLAEKEGNTDVSELLRQHGGHE